MYKNQQNKINLYDFQQNALDCTASKNRCAYYLDMGLGKTYVGAEKAISMNSDIVVVCQKSKVDDWVTHFASYYGVTVVDLTKTGKRRTAKCVIGALSVFVINYDLVWRRADFFDGMRGYTLLLDESSCIQNETSKRTHYIMHHMRFNNVILLSGTPCNGKYENLWTQCNLLGYTMSKDAFWGRYIRWIEIDKNGFPVRIVVGYKNVEELKKKLREYGAVFMKTSEVFSLPEQVISDIRVDAIREYKVFMRDRIVDVKDKQLVGSTPLVSMLYARQLAGAYNANKYLALSDLLASTTDRVIVFYNFDDELHHLIQICDDADRAVSIINGHKKDLTNYYNAECTVVLVQYQAGAMGLNLQLANKVVFFSPPLSCELYLQAFKRIHRIGQRRTCFYYRIIANGTVEEKIYNVLEKREDYTVALFSEDPKHVL